MMNSFSLIVILSGYFALLVAGSRRETGRCSFYGVPGEIPPGHRTASGEGFDRLAMKTAHKTLPFGTRIRVTNLQSKKRRSVVVTVNDRGPFHPGRILDLTYGAFRKIARHSRGVIRCAYRVLG